MLADGGRERRERNREPRVQQMTERHGRQLARVDVSTVRVPQDDGHGGRRRRDDPGNQQHERLGADARDRRHRMLRFDLQRAALTIAGDETDRDEREQEDRGDLAGAEGRRPDADERRERLADAGGRAVETARLGVGANGADERHADERSHRDEQHPPRARRHQLAIFLRDEPTERRNRRGRRARRAKRLFCALRVLCGSFVR